MTIFCGVFGLGGGDLRVDLSMMLTSGDGPENICSSWYSDGIALGQLTVQNTPESLNETLPLADTHNTVIVSGDIRLDNRSELCKQLSIPSIIGFDCGNAFLVASAYKKWGESLTGYLKGDFAFAIWDSTRKKLVCCTDHLGSRSIFYFFNGRKFIFASTPNPILLLNEVPKAVNLNKLSTIVFPATKHLFWTESWFKEISPVSAATVMTISSDGIRKQKYWEPDINKELHFKDEAAFEEAFKDVLFRAVGNRIRSNFPVTALLSGGLDSSAVVSVAAKILERQNRELKVFSSVLPAGSDSTLVDERYYIDKFKSFPNVELNYITAPGKGFFSDLEKLQTTIYFPGLIPSHYLYTAFTDAARQMGSRVILDGGGGELGISFHGEGSYAELFKKLRWQNLLHELKCQKKLTGEPLWLNTYNNVVKPLVPLKLLKKAISTSYITPKKQHYLQPGIQETLRLQLQPRKKELSNLMQGTSSSHRINLARQIRIAQAKAHGKADLGTVEPRYPLLDKEVLEFCLAAPLEFKVKNGYKRYMVRTGLNGILPPEIQWRNSKGAFSPDYQHRYQVQLPEVRAFLNEISPGDPVRQIVDIDKLKAWTNPVIQPGALSEKITLDVVPQGIYLIHFLRRFPEYR
ncbi:MAG: hypothetical protein JST50_15105 [Bacteroidetes bacterium]|jgi:asparagine synthase (glutamine-hydrolysing)|nr:hypothetical protein [Bacteroidota bacterium]